MASCHVDFKDMSSQNSVRRSFLSFLGRTLSFSGAAGLLETTPKAIGAPASVDSSGTLSLPSYARAPQHKTLRQSSFDRTGGNKDFYWDGTAHPSVEVPVGDFFGLNLGEYFVYQSAFLNCSSVKGLNCYFAMPFKRSARITVTNEGAKPVGSFYSNIDYQTVPNLPADAMYFHAQYRQATPTHADPAAKVNIDGRNNYVFVETQGRGQLMGVTLGVVQNRPEWFGEGDDMTNIDGSANPVITGTGTEDYFCGAWNFGGSGVLGAVPFAHLYNGGPYMANPERSGGRYCLYRWHADNPIAFERSLIHSIEHGHANDRSDCFYSTAYWFQTAPASAFPALPPVAQRVPDVKESNS